MSLFRQESIDESWDNGRVDSLPGSMGSSPEDLLVYASAATQPSAATHSPRSKCYAFCYERSHVVEVQFRYTCRKVVVTRNNNTMFLHTWLILCIELCNCVGVEFESLVGSCLQLLLMNYQLV